MSRAFVVFLGLSVLLSGCIFGEESNPSPSPSSNNTNNTSNNCTAESDLVLCSAVHQGRCGPFMTKDSCGVTRSLECGCQGDRVCEAGMCVESCVDAPVDVEAQCQNKGATCGMIEIPSACSSAPTMISCGFCAFGQACDANVCGVTRLLPPDAKGQLKFGSAVSAHAQRVAVGAPGAEIDNSNRQGAVYVFTKTASGWVASPPLVQAEGPPRVGGRDERFGESVALFGDWLAVGASGADVTADGVSQQNAGAVYLYRREGQAWAFKQRLSSDKPAGGGSFGLSVAMDEGHLVVGEPGVNLLSLVLRNAKGRAHIFKLSEDTMSPWTLVRSETDTASGTFFGLSVAVDRDRVLIGAPGTSNGAKADQGLVHERSVNDANKRASLVFGQLPAHSAFGWSVAARGGRALVGAPGSALKAQAERPLGVAVLYEEGAAPVPVNAEEMGGSLGYAVSLGEVRLAAAEPDAQNKKGQVRVLDAALAMDDDVVADRRKDDDQFGFSIAFGAGFLAIGSPGDDEVRENAGAVRIVEFAP